MIRRAFVKEARTENFEEVFTREIVFIAKDMGGWSIDDVLEMPILRYIEIRKAIQYFQDEDRKSMERSNTKQTFR